MRCEHRVQCLEEGSDRTVLPVGARPETSMSRRGDRLFRASFWWFAHRTGLPLTALAALTRSRPVAEQLHELISHSGPQYLLVQVPCRGDRLTHLFHILRTARAY